MSKFPMRWSLDELYTSFDSADFIKDFESLKQVVAKTNDWAGKELSSTENAIVKIEKMIALQKEMQYYEKLFSFAHLSISVDAENEKATKYLSTLMNIFSDSSKADVLFKSFLGKVGNISELAKSSEIIKEHEFVLNEEVEKKQYLLSEKEELIAAKLSITGSSCWGRMKEQLFSTLTADIPGVGEDMPMPAVRNLAYNSDPKIRRAAYDAELKAYEKIEVPVAHALNSVKGEVISMCAIRGYKSPLEMTLINSRVDNETFDAMISAMKDAFPSFRKYLRKKAELLGHKGGLPFYDLFAPVGGKELTYTYDEAAEFVVKNFSTFSQELGDFARNAFEKGWVDSEPRKGKRGGAFCSNLHQISQSRVLSNFSGSFSDMTTLAHELGHAFHGYCIGKESSLNRSYTMPIAETASTFCETLVCDAALKTATKEEGISIIENDISGVCQVIVDIYSRFLFEDELFNRLKTATLTPSELKQMMLSAQKESYGDGLDEDFLHPYMWICKPHYYYAGQNYYNWPYAFGQLFSKGLYAEFLKQGKDFVPKYSALLAATGKTNAYEIAKIAGIDTRDKAFWAASLKLTENDIDKFCAI